MLRIVGLERSEQWKDRSVENPKAQTSQPEVLRGKGQLLLPGPAWVSYCCKNPGSADWGLELSLSINKWKSLWYCDHCLWTLCGPFSHSSVPLLPRCHPVLAASPLPLQAHLPVLSGSAWLSSWLWWTRFLAPFAFGGDPPPVVCITADFHSVLHSAVFCQSCPVKR